MYNKITLLVIGLLFLFYGCKEQTNKKTSNNSHISTLESNCQIPLEIEAYLKKNSDKWTKIDLNDFDKELMSFLLNFAKYENSQICPYLISGDFTDDGNEDFAIILKNKTYKIEGYYKNYNFPFLVIFNDYKNEIKPITIYKTGLYKDADIKTVLYSEKEYGLLSYIENGKTCGVNVIDITYFEKSGFFVYWDKARNSYQFLNYLDENICDSIKNERTLTSGTWKFRCDGAGSLIIDGNKAFIEVNSNQIYIDALIKKKKENLYNVYLEKPNDLGSGGMRLNWGNFSKDSIIASFNYNQKSNSLIFNWHGFYDVSAKKRIRKEDSDFQLAAEKIKSIKLIKCD